jgi:hypothetical protein
MVAYFSREKSTAVDISIEKCPQAGTMAVVLLGECPL